MSIFTFLAALKLAGNSNGLLLDRQKVSLGDLFAGKMSSNIQKKHAIADNPGFGFDDKLYLVHTDKPEDAVMG